MIATGEQHSVREFVDAAVSTSSGCGSRWGGGGNEAPSSTASRSAPSATASPPARPPCCVDARYFPPHRGRFPARRRHPEGAHAAGVGAEGDVPGAGRGNGARGSQVRRARRSWSAPRLQHLRLSRIAMTPDSKVYVAGHPGAWSGLAPLRRLAADGYRNVVHAQPRRAGCDRAARRHPVLRKRPSGVRVPRGRQGLAASMRTTLCARSSILPESRDPDARHPCGLSRRGSRSCCSSGRAASIRSSRRNR